MARHGLEKLSKRLALGIGVIPLEPGPPSLLEEMRGHGEGV